MPINQKQKKIIIDKLLKIQEEKGFKVVYAVESGSRIWNMHSKNSDYDVRFIFKYPTEEYLKLKTPKDSFTSTSKDYDFSGTEIRKFAKLLLNSNASVIEWLNSPIVYIPYTKSIFWVNAKQIAESKYNPLKLYFHYRSMAWNNFSKYILRNNQITYKRYLYAFRGLFIAMTLKETGSLPCLDFKKSLEQTNLLDEYTKNTFLKIIDIKKQGKETDQIKRITTLDHKIQKYFDKYTKHTPAKNTNNEDILDLNNSIVLEIMENN